MKVFKYTLAAIKGALLGIMDIGEIWLVGISIVLLTELYAGSTYNSNLFFTLLWIFGLCSLLARFLVHYDKPSHKVASTSTEEKK